MLQYLSDRMYDEVRGPGLTYGVSMSASVTEGRLTLSLTRSTRPTRQFKRNFRDTLRMRRKPLLTLLRDQLSTPGQKKRRLSKTLLVRQ